MATLPSWHLPKLPSILTYTYILGTLLKYLSSVGLQILEVSSVCYASICVVISLCYEALDRSFFVLLGVGQVSLQVQGPFLLCCSTGPSSAPNSHSDSRMMKSGV